MGPIKNKTKQQDRFKPKYIKNYIKHKWFKHSNQKAEIVGLDLKDKLKWHRDRGLSLCSVQRGQVTFPF